MKPKLFLGSSSEAIRILNKVTGYLDKTVEVVTWTNKSVFTPNRGTLESLIKQTKLADFSILIATKDDLINSRGQKKKGARDNVIFEYGLFLGAAGIDRCFLLAEDGINLPSDFNGLSVLSFVEESGKYNSLEERCIEIANLITKVSSVSELGFVPSTALAIGYFSSFIKKVCDDIASKQYISYKEKKILTKTFKLYVVLPDDIDDDGVDNFTTSYNRANNLEPASTFEDTPGKRGYPFHFRIDIPDSIDPIDVVLHDVPTTINTIQEAIKLYYPVTKVGSNLNKEHIERRELKNFANVLRHLISRNINAKNNVIVLENVIV
jgi:hypothetical protein